MKILMVVGGYPPEDCGGTEVFTQILSEGLVNKYKCKVVVLCMGEQQSVKAINGVQVYRRKIRNIPFLEHFYLVYFINKILHMYNPFNKKMFEEILDKEKPDIIHINMLRMFSPSIVLVAKKRKIPIVQTLHELYSLWNFNPFKGRKVKNLLNSRPSLLVNYLREKQRKILTNIQAVTAPSQYVLNIFEEEGYYRFSRKEVIPNAFPYDMKKIENIYNERLIKLKKKQEINFLFVGRLVPEKGIELLLDVFLDIKSPSMNLFFMGTGPLENKIVQAIKQDNRIHYMGFLSGKEKSDAFKSCDVLILPSESTLFPETFGLVLLEAYMHGIPCIASNKGGIPEVVENSKTGILILPGSFLELKKAILYFSNPINIQKSLPYCLKKIKQYDYDIMLDEYISTYKYVLKSNIS